jgi:hypothetical protein
LSADQQRVHHKMSRYVLLHSVATGVPVCLANLSAIVGSGRSGPVPFDACDCGLLGTILQCSEFHGFPFLVSSGAASLHDPRRGFDLSVDFPSLAVEAAVADDCDNRLGSAVAVCGADDAAVAVSPSLVALIAVDDVGGSLAALADQHCAPGILAGGGAAGGVVC